MKKIYRLLMSVVAMAAVVGCTTDVTEDLSVKVGGKTQLTLSLDDTRTQLGDKTGDVYPVTWAENDQISVNGVTSEPLSTTNGAGTANAVFTFGGELKTPYCIAYPATAEGQVQLAAMQLHTAQATFANNAAAMYGYSANGENIKLKHLTGILKLTIAATDEFVDMKDAVKLNQVRISTVDRKPIAGVFDIDFITGELTPTKESTNVITYLFDGEPLFTGTSIDFYVAVPAGTYDELYVTIEDITGAIRYVTVKADSTAPLAAGMVREFSSPIVFEPINTEEVFVIKDYDSLLAFATAAKAGTSSAPVTKDAVFVNDVTIPESGWTTVSAKYYTGTINGNGYSISGLNKTLFGALGAKAVKGLHLTNVNISGDQGLASASSGKSIGVMIAEYWGFSVTHCSASGSMNITGVTGARRIGSIIGTIIGGSQDAEVSYCVNSVNMTIHNAKTNKSNTSSIGGVVGMTATDSEKTLTLRGCVNEGTITLTGTNTVAASERIGGIGGFLGQYSTIVIEDCVNNGTVKVDADAHRGTVNDTRSIDVGGVLGSTSKPCTMTNCHNTAVVTVSTHNIGVGVYIGGLVGRQANANLTINNCGNSGTVSTDIKACTPDNTATDKTKFAHHIGGFVGLHSITADGVVSSITNVTIADSGKVSCSGYYVLTNSTTSSTTPCTKNEDTWVYAGGVIGKVLVADGITPDYTYNNWTNTGSVEILVGDAGLNDSQSYFGGVVGYLPAGATVTNAQCYGSVKVYQTKTDASKVSYTNVGMLVGNYGATFTNSAVGGTYEDATSVTTLGVDNYTKYLFNDRELASYDGVSLLTSKPL